jgi:hypothetical protein
VPSAPPASSFQADAGTTANGLGNPSAGAADGQLQPLLPTMPFRRAYAAAPSVMAHHLHPFGGFCEGTLHFTQEALIFTSDVHSFSLTRDQIASINGDVVVENSGRRWRFEIPGGNQHQVHNVLNRWFNALPNPH